MVTKEKFQEDLLDSVESLCRLSNTLIMVRRSGDTPNFRQSSESIAEHVAEVNVQLNRIVDEMGISEDVGWWYTKKKQRLQDE